MALLSYEGVNLFYENEAGAIMGIPLCATVILSIWALMIASFSRKKAPSIIRLPQYENALQNRLQLAAIVIIIGVQAIKTEVYRPYARVIADMNVRLLENDWQGIMNTARDNATLSHRPIAAE